MLTKGHPGRPRLGVGVQPCVLGTGIERLLCARQTRSWVTAVFSGGMVVPILQMRKLVKVTGNPLEVASPAVTLGVGSASGSPGFGDSTRL